MYLGTSSVYAYELMHPRQKNNTVTSNYALFVGRVNKSELVTINREKIVPASNGAFAYSVKLRNGENRIIIRSNLNTQVYKFCKKYVVSKDNDTLNEIPCRAVIVKRDNTPLRSSPVDGGINRISHLFKDTTVIIDAEKGDFYRVFLSKDKLAWLAKKDVEEICDQNSIKIAEFVSVDSQKFKNANIQQISFTKNIPYTVEEQEKEILFRVYNPEVSDSSVYTLNIPRPEKYFYNITLRNGVYTFKVTELPSLEDITVAIDAGHGGSEKGAIGCFGDEEKSINLKIAREVEKQLRKRGINVIMTRECDGNISLNDRVKIAKDNDADIFVSIHLNSIGDVPFNLHKHKGTSVYYFNKNSKELAEILEKSVTKAAGTRNDGVRTGSFAVIRPTHYIGVLVEAAYMINPHDTILYTSKDFVPNVAKGITDGIMEYISE